MSNESNSWAVTYRPQKLEDMIGQESAVKKLKGALKSGSIPHAFLFTGQTSAGKTTMARALANAVNDYPKGGSQDIVEYNIGDTRGIDDIREIITTSQYMPEGKFRCIILDECHQLTKQAASALLKPLEEPHKHLIWMLATDQPDKLLNTIVGRCMPIALHPYTSEAIYEILKRVYKKEKLDWGSKYKKILKAVAEASGNQPRLSLQLLQGVASEIVGGSKVTSATVEKVAESLPAWELSKTAGIVIMCMYVGNLRAMLKILSETKDLVGLINVAIELHKFLIDDACGAKTYRSFPRIKLKQSLEGHSKLKKYPSIEEIVSVHNVWTELKLVSASYAVGEYHLMASKIGEYIVKRFK